MENGVVNKAVIIINQLFRDLNLVRKVTDKLVRLNQSIFLYSTKLKQFESIDSFYLV